MKQRLVLLILCILNMTIIPTYAADANTQKYQAVYLGVENYGSLNRNSMDLFRHRFCINGQPYSYIIPNNGGAYTIQDKLQEGYVYNRTC